MKKHLHGMNNLRQNTIPASIASSQYVISNTTNPATYVFLFCFQKISSEKINLNDSLHYVGEPKKRSFQVLERRHAEIHDANATLHPAFRVKIPR